MSNGYTLTGSDLLNEMILKHEKICIATKRGLSGTPFYRWFTRGRDQFETPLTYALHAEVTNYVDVAWIGGPNKERLASVVLAGDGMLEIEESENTRSLDNYYKSFT
jgi:hypothetical protein